MRAVSSRHGAPPVESSAPGRAAPNIKIRPEAPVLSGAALARVRRYPALAALCLSAPALAAAAHGEPRAFAVFAVPLACALAWHALSGRAAPAPSAARIASRDVRPGALARLLGPLMRTAALRRVQSRIESASKNQILRAGRAANPRLVGSSSVSWALASAVPAAPLAALAAWHGSPWAAAALAAPPALMAARLLALRARASERGAQIDEEVAHFAAMASVLESAGAPLHSVLSGLSDSGTFGAMRAEGRRLRDLAALGRGPTEALLDVAATHPSSRFRALLEGYVSAFNTGGADTAGYLREQARALLSESRSRMRRYAGRADSAAQAILAVMLLLPVMGLSLAFLSAGGLAGAVMALMIAAMPPAAAAMIAAVHASQPGRRDPVRVRWHAFAAGAAAGAAVHLAGGQAWEAAGAAVVCGSAANALLTREAFARQAALEAPLPEFLMRMARLRNVGMGSVRALGEVGRDAAERAARGGRPLFNRRFDLLVAGMHRSVSAGSTLSSAVEEARVGSWMARVVFYTLGRVHESGGDTAGALDGVARWVSGHAEAKKEMSAGLRGAAATAFAGPVLMVMVSEMSARMAREMEGRLEGAALALAAPAPDGLSGLLAVTASACMGAVLSKVSCFTVRNTALTCAITGTTMALMYAAPHVPGI